MNAIVWHFWDREILLERTRILIICFTHIYRINIIIELYMDKLSVLTWNIYSGLPWGFSINTSRSRIDRIIKYIDTQDSDIVCLQEVHTKELIDLFKKKFGDKYHFYYDERNLIFQYILLFSLLFILYYIINNVYAVFGFFIFINFIFKNLTAYIFTFGETSGGLLTLVSRDINQSNIEFKKTQLFEEQGGDKLNFFNKRGFHKIVIQNLVGINRTEPLVVINAHMNTLSNGQFNNKMYPIKCEYREKQIREVEEQTMESTYCIVGCDFNTLECHNEFHFEEYGLVDSMRYFKNEDCTWDTNNDLTYKSGVNDQNTRIDYILVKNLKLYSAEVVFKKPPASDHYGITTLVDLRKEIKEEIKEEIKDITPVIEEIIENSERKEQKKNKKKNKKNKNF